MFTLLKLLSSPRAIAALVLAALLGLGWFAFHRALAHADSAGYQRAQGELRDAALKEQQAKALEGLRRLEAQDANQRKQDELVARMQHDRDDAIAAADGLRKQSAEAAREWGSRLADSPSREDLAAAASAIQQLTDVRSRLEHAGAELAGNADAARAAGLKCEADYDALTKK